MVMSNSLKFLRSFSLEEFKEWKGISFIRIIRNEQTGRYFFGYGDKAGAVTSKYPVEKLDHPVISEVISEESGEQFFLLHNVGDNPQFTTVALTGLLCSLTKLSFPVKGQPFSCLIPYQNISCNYDIHNARLPKCG